MPLLEMSPNIQEAEPAGHKRNHDEFADDLVKVEDDLSDGKMPATYGIQPENACLLSPMKRDAPEPPDQESPALTEAGSSTPTRKSPTPETPTKPVPGQASGNVQPEAVMASSDANPGHMANPTAKRKRFLTPAEKEARDKEIADKKKEKEEKAALRAVEKAKAEEEKAARAKEREEKRKKKEEEDREKAQARNEKKRLKEEEQQRIQDEKEKEVRKQKTLSSFFRPKPTTPRKVDGEVAAKDESPSKDGPSSTPSKEESLYRAMFKPFYVKKDTRLASSPTQMDEETREVKSRILDEFISGQRAQDSPKASFDPVELFTPIGGFQERGRQHHPVKHIMEQVYKEADGSGATGAGEANEIIKKAQTKLAKVPMKVIAFSQDVRPPYYGTVTFKPFALGQANMKNLARRPVGRRLPLDYDYDSEAEWQDDEGEDLDIDDDEEELEDEDDMDGFLDDSEDAGPARRLFGNTVMEPTTTGVCFENDRRRGPSQTAYEHAMEFMHEGLDHSWGIDPFSTKYWEPEPRTKSAAPGDKGPKMAPPPAPSNAFSAMQGGAGAGVRPEKMVKDELLNDIKQAILANKALTKVGIVDFIFQQFKDGASRTEVKNTIEHIAEKKGSGRSKEWALKPGHDITT